MSILLGVSWVVAMIAALLIGIASGPERPGPARWQEPGMGAAMVVGGSSQPAHLDTARKLRQSAGRLRLQSMTN